MGARYLCQHCGLNHDYRQECPLKLEHADKQRNADLLEAEDIRHWENWHLLAAAVTDARKRAEVRARLERTLMRII